MWYCGSYKIIIYEYHNLGYGFGSGTLVFGIPVTDVRLKRIKKN